MNYTAVFQMAHELANQQVQNGQYLLADDMVCVLCSASERLYSGISRREERDGETVSIRADEEAIRKMLANGEREIAGLILMTVISRMQYLPSDVTLRRILILHPNNRQCELMMPDRAVRIEELNLPDIAPAITEQPDAGNPTGNLLMGKVNSLLHAADDEDDEDDEIDGTEETKEKPKKSRQEAQGEKRRFGGLFRRK